jgi:hypothetical protein
MTLRSERLHYTCTSMHISASRRTSFKRSKLFPYLAQGTPGCGHVRWGPTDLSGRIPLNLLSPFACTGFCFVFCSPHRVSSDTDLAQRRIRTSCVYVTHLILWSDFSVRLSIIPVTVTTNSSFSIRRSLDAGATSFSGRSKVRSLPGEFRIHVIRSSFPSQRVGEEW